MKKPKLYTVKLTEDDLYRIVMALTKCALKQPDQYARLRDRISMYYSEGRFERNGYFRNDL